MHTMNLCLSICCTQPMVTHYDLPLLASHLVQLDKASPNIRTSSLLSWLIEVSKIPYVDLGSIDIVSQS